MSTDTRRDEVAHSVLVTITKDSRVCVRLPARWNPYKLAVGELLTDVPEIVASQFSTFPNSHLICSLKLCERALGIEVSVQVETLRGCILLGIRLRDYGLHLANCIQAGIFSRCGKNTALLRDAALNVALVGREVEKTFACIHLSPNRLFLGGAAVPEKGQILWTGLMLIGARVSATQLLEAVIPLQATVYDDLMAEIVLLESLISDITQRMSINYVDEPTVPIGQINAGQYMSDVLATRGLLRHIIVVGEDGRLESGEVIIPTELKRPKLEAKLGLLVEIGRNKLVRSCLERELVDAIRIFNPCGVDVSGDFVEFVWEE